MDDSQYMAKIMNLKTENKYFLKELDTKDELIKSKEELFKSRGKINALIMYLIRILDI